MQESDETPDPWLPRLWQVVSTRRESWDTTTLTIQPQDGAALGTLGAADPRSPRPGQFNMLYAFGIGEIPISFSSIDGGSVSHTIRGVGRVSNALSRLGPGSLLGVRGPFGTSWTADADAGREIVIMAGGVGLAPLKPLVDAVCRDRERYARVHVLYGARDPDNLIFASEFETWERALDFKITVDSADVNWHRGVGVVMSLLDRVDLNPANATAFVCGPEVMMRYSIEKLASLGVDEQNIYLSMERNMKCAVGFCGHCQFGGSFICRQGPVYAYPAVARHLGIPEL